MLEGYAKVFNFDAKQVAEGLQEYALRKVAEDLAALPSDNPIYRPLDHKEP
jgi:chaperonin cofactor prefoldin